jgi:ComF family protein
MPVMKIAGEILQSLLHYCYPHICAGCGNELFGRRSEICLRCLHAMPATHFEIYPRNPAEKIFWGRLKLESATAQFYFTKDSIMQSLMHELKYRGNKELGIQLGRIMGGQIQKSNRFSVDGLVPLPLFPAKEKKRGYNQAALLCTGIAEIMKIPVLDKVVIRPAHTETQTRKGRIERWKNIEGKFMIKNASDIENNHLLLVDDVVTTGATLESCGNEILKAASVRLSVAALCIA